MIATETAGPAYRRDINVPSGFVVSPMRRNGLGWNGDTSLNRIQRSGVSPHAAHRLPLLAKRHAQCRGANDDRGMLGQRDQGPARRRGGQAGRPRYRHRTGTRSGIPGTPKVADTIYEKIDRATVFLSDLTYVALRPEGGGIPNPNVSIEHGWALKALGPRRVISVMNTAFGHPREHELPFDLRHVKWPISYECAAEADGDARTAARKQLTRVLTGALMAIFADEATMAELLPAPPAEPHPHDVDLLRRVHRQLPLDLRRFLHEHSFGSPFRIATLDPIHAMNDGWLGAAYGVPRWRAPGSIHRRPTSEPRTRLARVGTHLPGRPRSADRHQSHRCG